MGDIAEVNVTTQMSNSQTSKPEQDGLKIFVIGGGIAGLTAAIALRQQGHRVEVFEQSKLANEIGAAIHITPNATGVLRQLGVDPLESGAVHLEQTKFLNSANELLNVNDDKKRGERWQNPWLLAHRAHLHTQLKKKATSEQGHGFPATLHTSHLVRHVDPEKGNVYFEDGTTDFCDVIVGADGIQSNTRKAIMSDAPSPQKGHHNAFRFIVETKVVLQDPETESFGKVPGSMEMWYGPDRKIVMYPTTNNQLLNFVCIHPASLSEVSNEYDKSASKEKLLEIFKDFHPSMVKLLGKADADTLKVYSLFDMEKLPTFTRGRLALIGDAAHPFTPHLGQGGAQAIEDAASIGVMLSQGVTSGEVLSRLELYNKARYGRASLLQEYSRIVGEDGTADTKESADTNNRKERFKVHEIGEYGFSHDEIHASTQILREYQWSQQQVFWRQPTVFGPMPGPRQDYLGVPRTSTLKQSWVTIASITFKTSATLLQNLFPNKSYSFTSRDTVATARFSVETLHNLAWLGGGSYSLMALYVNGISYRTSSGELISGSYCPIMFENLTDPILSGREELGAPKVFSDIDITQSDGNYKAAISWRGQKWADFEWTGLQQQEAVTNGVENDVDWSKRGLLWHKCIPATGQNRGKIDVKYDVLIPGWGKSSPDKSSMQATHSNFDIYDLGEKKLPTLHHIIFRLAELPVFQILESRVFQKDGMNDLSSIQVLD